MLQYRLTITGSLVAFLSDLSLLLSYFLMDVFFLLTLDLIFFVRKWYILSNRKSVICVIENFTH
jgi:hypothetical protein